MNTLITIARELFGLFVDDGSLALSVLALIAFTAVVLWAVPDGPLVGGGVLLLGCLAALFINVAKSARNQVKQVEGESMHEIPKDRQKLIEHLQKRSRLVQGTGDANPHLSNIPCA